MNGKDFRRWRTDAGYSQAQVGEALGISANYVSIVERSDEEVEPRIVKLAEALFLPRIDVGYSEALRKWVVTVIKPATTFAGREHHVLAVKDSLSEANKIAHAEWEKTDKQAMFITRHPDGRLERP